MFSGSLDTNGNMTATFDFNDVLSTNTGLTTYYQLTIKDSGGGQVWNEFYYLTGTAANLNLIPPLGNPPGTVPLTVTAQGTGASITTAGYGGFWSAGFPLQAMNGYGISPGAIVCTLANNQVIVWQFILDSTWTIRSVSCNVTLGYVPGGPHSVNFGIYSAAGNLLLDSGALSAATTNAIESNTITPTTVGPGVYYFAAACTTENAQFSGFVLNSLPLLNIVNGVGTLKIAYASNLLSSGALPGTLGILTTTAVNAPSMPAAFFGV